MFERTLKKLLKGALGVLPVVAVLASSACSDQSSGSPTGIAPGHARLSVAPTFQAAPAGAPTVDLSRVRGVLIGAAGDSSVVDVRFSGDSAVLSFDVQFSGASATFTLNITAYDDQNVIAYRATQTITLTPGDNSPPAPVLVYSAPDAGLTKLQLSPATVTINAGGSSSLSASGFTASGQPITPLRLGWTSRDPTVATVDGSGSITAGQFQGSTYIVAQTATGVMDSALVKVHAPVDKVVVAPATLDVVRGLTGAVGAELRDAGGHLIDDRAATWTSSDPSVATVSPLGVISGLKLGTATITATAEGKSGSAIVTVVTPIDHIDLTPAALTLSSLTQTQTLIAKVVGKSGASVDGITPSFASSNSSVATVDASGKVTAVSNGTATITAIAEGVGAATNVTVHQVAVAIAIAPKSAGVTALNDKRTFTATATDSLGQALPTDQITFTSVDPTIATVSASGIAVGHKNGSTQIVAVAGTKADTAVFTVAQIPAFISVSSDRNQIQVGQTAQLTGKVADASGAPIGTTVATWTADNPQIAIVTSSGVVTGVYPGTAHFTARAGGLTGGITITVTAGPNQAGTITGQIIDGSTGLPIAGATVAGPSSISATTSSSGAFSLGNVLAGATLSITASGFTPTQYFSVQLTGATTSVGVIPLAPVSQATGTIYSGVEDATTGNSIAGAVLEVRSGVNATTGPVVLQTTTDVEGAIVSNLPAGTYTIVASAAGYTPASGVYVSIGGTSNDAAPIVLNPTGLSATSYRFVLQWGATPPDLDAHLVGPTGGGDSTFEIAYYSPYYQNSAGMTASLDLDATEGYGPETISLLQPVPGLYRFYVHKFCCDESFATSNARVNVYKGSALQGVYNVPNADGVVWTVLELNTATGTITPINTISQTYDIPPGSNSGESGSEIPPGSSVRIPVAHSRTNDIAAILSRVKAHPKTHQKSPHQQPSRTRRPATHVKAPPARD